MEETWTKKPTSPFPKKEMDLDVFTKVAHKNSFDEVIKQNKFKSTIRRFFYNAVECSFFFAFILLN